MYDARIWKTDTAIEGTYCDENIEERRSNYSKRFYLSKTMTSFKAVNYFETPEIENSVN